MIAEKLKRCLSEERKDKTIFDIILFGSHAKGKLSPRDIDIAIIFKEGTLKARLSRVQEIKKKLRLTSGDQELDVTGILWEELFQESYFARTGIFLEGISMLHSKPFAQRIGFEGWTIFTYSLADKTHTEKVKFNYILTGRNTKGMIRRLDGEHMTPGAVRIPISRSIEFEELLKMHKVSYSKRRMLMLI
ncbi:MAG: nucleotidyltransferase domain-containing protein [Nanoarchaeota archaeon]